MNRTILMDCDGVLLNWRDPFNSWLHEMGLVDDLKSWPEENYFFGNVLKVDSALELPLMRMYNQSYNIACLPPIKGAVEAVKYLHGEGFTLKVITSFSSEYKSIKMREENLINTFGNVFQDITCIPIRGDKEEYLARQPKDSFFVEDIIPNVLAGIKAGLEPENCFLIPQAYNSGKVYEENKEALKGVTFGRWDRIVDFIY